MGKDDEELNGLFEGYKQSTLEKLDVLSESNHDDLTRNKINETISFVKQEEYNKYNYVKLKNLYERL